MNGAGTKDAWCRGTCHFTVGAVWHHGCCFLLEPATEFWHLNVAQIQVLTRGHFSPIRWATLRKSSIITHPGGKWGLWCSWRGCQLVQPRWEAIKEQLLKFEMYIFYGPAFLVSALEKHAHLCTRRLMRDVTVNQKNPKKPRNCLAVCSGAGCGQGRG